MRVYIEELTSNGPRYFATCELAEAMEDPHEYAETAAALFREGEVTVGGGAAPAFRIYRLGK